MYIGTSVTSPGGKFTAAVLIDGSPQPLYRRYGDGKVFVAGEPGRIYTLRVNNPTPDRIEVINTVDGRHTLDDEPGDTHRNHGLVFAARGYGEFTGWRIDSSTTRQFVFGNPARSIATQATGSTDNVGVIGFAAHSESPSHRYGDLSSLAFPSRDKGLLGGSPTTYSSSRSPSLGTGMGAPQEDRVGNTKFNRDGLEPDILVIGYHLEEVLHQMGIITPPEANAFPGAKTGYDKFTTRQ